MEFAQEKYQALLSKVSADASHSVGDTLFSPTVFIHHPSNHHHHHQAQFRVIVYLASYALLLVLVRLHWSLDRAIFVTGIPPLPPLAPLQLTNNRHISDPRIFCHCLHNLIIVPPPSFSILYAKNLTVLALGRFACFKWNCKLAKEKSTHHPKNCEYSSWLWDFFASPNSSSKVCPSISSQFTYPITALILCFNINTPLSAYLTRNQLNHFYIIKSTLENTFVQSVSNLKLCVL